MPAALTGHFNGPFEKALDGEHIEAVVNCPICGFQTTADVRVWTMDTESKTAELILNDVTSYCECDEDAPVEGGPYGAAATYMLRWLESPEGEAAAVEAKLEEMARDNDPWNDPRIP